MNPEFLDFYNKELHFIRELGAEFAQDFPKIAAGLALDSNNTDTCPDPYIERLLEGFAFLSAGIKHKINGRFPVLNQHLLELIYPHYLAPLPSMFIAELEPKLDDPSLIDGITLAKGTRINSDSLSSQGSQLSYITAHQTELWPLAVIDARYASNRAELLQYGLDKLPRHAAAGMRLRLRITAGIALEQLSALDQLSVYLHGENQLCYQLYEQLFGHTLGYIIRPVGGKNPWYEWRDSTAIQHRGFADEDAILPYTTQSFSGYRLLQEYFAFPQRLRFFQLTQLQAALSRCQGTEIDIIFIFDKAHSSDLQQTISADNFKLHCTPVVNLFKKSADPISLKNKRDEYHIVVERTRAIDYEIHSVTQVVGHANSKHKHQTFYPLYKQGHDENFGFYTLKRQPRKLSSDRQTYGSRSHYNGSELFISLSDPQNPPYRSDLKHLQIDTLCTNRDLSILMNTGSNGVNFIAECNAPLRKIHCLSGPTQPQSAHYYGDRGWNLIHHLSLNYLSMLADPSEDEGQAVADATATLKKMLQLYASNSPALEKKINAIHSIYSKATHYRLPAPGPITYVRGNEIHLTCNEDAFNGDSLFLFGQVLSEFFQRYTSIHSLTGLRLHSQQRGELQCWKPKIGQQKPL